MNATTFAGSQKALVAKQVAAQTRVHEKGVVERGAQGMADDAMHP